ncbi:hypothetical protein PLICRDRAFT_38777 [Plicaturopsis crispa FD-325 SS-3]|nr:hypothetical protein PLICRDRAFT_38777 [Plicaturopsis crispa FD-325 SS-3]
MPPIRDAAQLRKECPRFRILIVGRANAGKTTLCQKMCNSTEPPIVRNADGAVISVDPSSGRGIHNIDDEITFKANPRFVFHDSSGFEGASVAEVTLMKNFIEKRLQGALLEEQLHAIWYCLPVDDARPFSPAEKEFFKGGTGPVPVILIFTKMDGLLAITESEIEEQLEPGDENLEILTTIRAEDYIKRLKARLKATRYPPSAFVSLKNMNRLNADCSDLVEKTAESITDKQLLMLFLSVQTANIKICIHTAICHVVEEQPTSEKVALACARWFPHLYPSKLFLRASTHDVLLRRGSIAWATVLLIILEHSFWCDGTNFPLKVQTAVSHYRESPLPSIIEREMPWSPHPWRGMSNQSREDWYNFVWKHILPRPVYARTQPRQVKAGPEHIDAKPGEGHMEDVTRKRGNIWKRTISFYAYSSLILALKTKVR